MSGPKTLSQPPGDRVMTPEIAALVVELIQRLDGTSGELADALAEANAVREQRNMALAEAHRLHRRVNQLGASHAVTCERTREQQREIMLLRARVSELERNLAHCLREAAA